MVMAAGMFALSESFRDMTEGLEVLDALERQLRSIGAVCFLATGIPLPGRPIEPLILRATWGEVRPGGSPPVGAAEPLLQIALRAKRPVAWLRPDDEPADLACPLLDEIGPRGKRQIVIVPVDRFLPYQAAVIIGGSALALDERAALVLGYLCDEAFRRMFELRYLKPERAGDLSARERRVVTLSALGKTANEIAGILEISQRTVHAHLQNASEKLHAGNKTHTVVAALLYGQITI